MLIRLSKSFIKRVFIVVVASTFAFLPCHDAWGDEPTPDGARARNNLDDRLDNYLAPYLLRCAAGRKDCDSIVTRTYAFLRLGMPSHAAESIRNSRQSLQPVVASVIEGAIAQMASDENSEYSDFLKSYMPLIGSTNLLLDAHLSKLRSIAGGGIVTNPPIGTTLDVRMYAQDPNRTTVVVMISANWLKATCSSGSFKQLADQVRLVAELRRKKQWQVVVIISQLPSQEAMSLQVITGRDMRVNESREVVLSTDQFFNGDDKRRERAYEDLILKAL